MASSIPAFLAALKARLAADATITAASAQVTLGNPAPAAPQAKVVGIGGDVADRRLDYIAAMTQANESYVVDVVAIVEVSVHDTPDGLLTAAYALIDAIEASVLAWSKAGCGGTASSVAPVGGSHSMSTDGTVRDLIVVVRLQVTARISF